MDRFYQFWILSTIFSGIHCLLSPAEERFAEKLCVHQVGIDYSVITKVKNNLRVPRDRCSTPKYKEFLNCYYARQGFLTFRGKVLLCEIKLVLTRGEDGYTEEQADEILNGCRHINFMYEYYVPYYFLDCFFKRALQMDARIRNQMQISNQNNRNNENNRNNQNSRNNQNNNDIENNNKINMNRKIRE